jgi:hypothetical protein
VRRGRRPRLAICGGFECGTLATWFTCGAYMGILIPRTRPPRRTRFESARVLHRCHRSASPFTTTTTILPPTARDCELVSSHITSIRRFSSSSLHLSLAPGDSRLLPPPTSPRFTAVSPPFPCQPPLRCSARALPGHGLLDRQFRRSSVRKVLSDPCVEVDHVSTPEGPCLTSQTRRVTPPSCRPTTSSTSSLRS